MDSISASKTKLSKDFFHRGDQDTTPHLDNSHQMWEYKNRGIINGVPVSQDAKNLLVNSIDQVKEALQPSYDIKVWSGYLSPQKEDKKYLEEYRQIMQKSVDSSIAILKQHQFFRADIGKVMVTITYAEVEMQLNPRYSHLKQEF